ncbi:CPBP family glutamic-type intramembrane protease [Novosphingobium panipatense]|jgi:membrane protease YdiL (CAAX protease family)|uniref:CPBP family glutamic-type intramembrane protease n=1 Tax=Novosphingobium TaxID=165696 RepID=UPI000CDB922F|nr:CPBP family glutamic-type intramembrane protease [Novosphingobium sp. HII-3]
MTTTQSDPSPRTAPAVLPQLARFLARPQVLTPIGLRSGSGWRILASVTALHLAGMLLLILPLLTLWQKTQDLPLPDAFGKVPSHWLLPLTILAAPVLEESIFRGWQTGRPRALWLLGCFAALVAIAALAPGLDPIVLIAAIGVMAAAAGVGWFRLRKRKDAPKVYRAAYPIVFWVVALAFAAVHLMNYPSASLLSLPMVLPQLWAALLLGFTRQRVGLVAAMLQHGAANAASMALALAGN